ncbi:unnamed protein product, partial [Mesorhabditis belari]|uniref:Cytosolic carboxypeptidase 1 n=1 Tax=Mesorhabditis belari TaxID=2138241 RepID=A0AAF3EDF1_9BILA
MVSDGDEKKTTSESSTLAQLLELCNGNEEDRGKGEELADEIIKTLETAVGRKRIDKELIANGDRKLNQLLTGIQSLHSDPVLEALLLVLESFIVHSNAHSKRLRKVARLDGVSCLIRTIRTAFKQTTTIAIIARLADMLLIVAVKDRKLALKLRMSGTIPSIVSSTLDSSKIERKFQLSLLRLLCRALRSPRNAQMISKHRPNLIQIVTMLTEFHREDRERTSTASETLLYALARLLESMFLIAKNKKARTHLANEATRIVHEIWLYNLNERRNSLPEIREEVALVATAVLRLLVKNKKSKEVMVQLDTVRICGEIVANESEKSDEAQNPLIAQLQESLCGLCLRCMPTEPFPLPASTSFPYTLILPAEQIERRRSISRTVHAARPPSTSKTRIAANGNDGTQEAFLGSSEDEDVGEEDEFLTLLESRDFRKLNGKGDGLLIGAEDEETATEKDKPQIFNRQETLELRENYESAFSEFDRGVEVSFAGFSQPPTHLEAIRAEVMTSRSVIRFVKIAYPEICGPDIDLEMQPFKSTNAGVRTILTSQLAHSRIRNEFERRVVYSLDSISDFQSTADSPRVPLGNDDVQRVGRVTSIDHLLFESRFEAGNLRMATMVGPNHYELILSPDVNETRNHFQWFYFEISNNRANVPYTFEIINCLKPTSMFGRGMQPVMFSVSEAMEGRPGWVRAGQKIHYYRNLYTLNQENDENDNKRPGCLYTTRFTVSFRHKFDVIYIAYHFPYTYSFMKTIIHRHLITGNSESSRIRADVIGQSLAGNPIHVLTITAPGTKEEIEKREIIVLMSRVHPGESNASWMMHGILNTLTANNRSIRDLLSRFIFKVIPMLNPDGVINGSHRCSLAGVDLNRVWDRPSKSRHPEIYHAKGLVQYMVEVLERRPFCVIDLHGHSRKMNVFMYGNNPMESWRLSDRQSFTDLDENPDFRFLPEILDKLSPGFSLKCCRFSITKPKEASARIALWRQFSLSRVYTMESTYCGFDAGKYHGYQIGVFELKEVGAKLIASISALQTKKVDDSLGFLREAANENSQNSQSQQKNRKSDRSRSKSATKSGKRATIEQVKCPRKHKSILED